MAAGLLPAWGQLFPALALTAPGWSPGVQVFTSSSDLSKLRLSWLDLLFWQPKNKTQNCIRQILAFHVLTSQN